MTSLSIDPSEIEKFSAMAAEWWDPAGPFKPLHDINPLRLGYIRDHAAAHFGMLAGNPPLTPLAGISALDIGCGGGLISEPLAQMGAQVTGIDASEKNIKTALAHQGDELPHLTYRCATAEELAAEGAQYDLVLSLEVVEHVADVEAFLSAMAALLRPGGMMVLSTINRTLKAWLFAIAGAEYVLHWLPRGTHQWDKFLKPSEIMRHLRPHGLTVMEMKGLSFHPLRRDWSLNDSIEVNYMMCLRKEEIA